MADGSSTDIVRETMKTIEFVKANWTDAFGKEYVIYLENVLQELRSMERQREIVELKKEKIRMLCEEFDSEDDPKILTRW